MGGKPVVVIPGQRYGRWTILEEVGIRHKPSGEVVRQCLCQCSCGNTKIVGLGCLRTGSVASCGCLRDEKIAAVGRRNTTHGKSHTPTHRAWSSMFQRCHNPNHKFYSYYGGRGIAICQRWQDSFESFLEDMGELPSPLHSLDRIDNDGDYCPSNCRWATQKEQRRNTRINIMLTYQGKTLCLGEWAEITGLNYYTLYSRVKSGWTDEDVLTKPIGANHGR